MRTIRGFDWIYYGDGTDSGQHLIEAIDIDNDRNSILIKFNQGHIGPVIKALQENDTLFAQDTDGLYEIRYVCGFKSLDAASVPDLEQVSLKLIEVRHYAGKTPT